MQKMKTIEDSYQALWFEQVIDLLEQKSATSEDVSRIINDVIGEYVVGEITLSQLLTVSTALENCKAELDPEVEYLIKDFSELHQYKHDQQYINNILLDVLKKISNT